MPSFFRQRSSSPTYSVVIPEVIPTKTMAFVAAPTSRAPISRPLTNLELWALYYFETHARTCSSCRDPVSVHRAGGRLCSRGHALAQDVARILWSRGHGREIYDASATGDSLIQVEIPQDYDETRSLLKAMERSLKHRRQPPIVSFDRTYSLPVRTPKTVTRAPERKRSVREYSPPTGNVVPTRSGTTRPQPVVEPEPQAEYERRAPEIVNWPEAEYEIREPSHVIQPNQAPKPERVEAKREPETAASPAKQSASPVKRVSFQTTQPISYSTVPHTSSSTRTRSNTMPTSERRPRPQSMLVDLNTFNVEVREPKGRSKRKSTLFF